ncbi:sulfotransferase 6B1-like isoform X2 [Aquarana catesbeiana]|uniref:sulfotransferase 6B1-like isoform X2 n=1 Tax=Aquarana catesbeiana TaxID=8400 RepID=UPI003CC9DEA9
MADMTQFLQEVTKAFETSKNIPKDELIFTYDGVLYPTATCDMDTFKALETFETREDDVMLAAYPKCVVWGSYFDHAVVWNKHLDTDTVLLMTFEDMKEVGEVGDWKNYFSGAQSQEMDAEFEKSLSGTNLGNVLKYNIYCKW